MSLCQPFTTSPVRLQCAVTAAMSAAAYSPLVLLSFFSNAYKLLIIPCPGPLTMLVPQVHSVGDWWEADPKSQLFQMAERAVRREWGVDPLYVREGGTMPVASLIEKMLGAPALMIPMGQSSDNCHLANERLRRLNLIKGKNVVRHLLEEVAAAATAAGAATPCGTPSADAAAGAPPTAPAAASSSRSISG